MKTLEKKNLKTKGRSDVEERLIQAAGELLAQYGPKAVSNREIADRAGVNHGQIHHYFGSQRELLHKAITKLAVEHWERTHRVGLQPLGLGIDRTYIIAVIRCAIDGDLDLATLELREGLSIPRKAIEQLIYQSTDKIDDAEAKARVATVMSLEIAWALLEPYITTTLQISENEINVVKDHVTKFILSVVDYPSVLPDFGG